ncbi:MAG: hypothetical protein QXO71_04780 [Candidatus Jordarchaeaceae archaeon]
MSRRKLIKEIVAAFGAALLLGGIVAIPAATVLTLYFPEKLVFPVYWYASYNWTQVRIVPPGQMSFVGVYLNYGDGMAGAFVSTIRVNAYIMDAPNFFNYIQGATFFTPILKGQPSQFSPFGYTASSPGFYYLIIENYSPYPAFVVLSGSILSTIAVPVENLHHYLSELILRIALIATLIGGIFYLPLRIWDSKTKKKKKQKNNRKSIT